ncbi:hypothetical protein PIB30_054717 [Stylosanthes scabra]|uniref:Uncharacterized protein n=1 Tax=Stylosanthes scabra TaxID=79078 RepID=A0ABU6ZHJ9_9FABA|nr:hypothetical protein [Stylosanthes scabra]
MPMHLVQQWSSRFCCDPFVPFALSGQFRSELRLLNPETLEHTYQGIIGLEFALVAKTKAEKALLAAEDQASVLKVEKNSVLEKVARLDEDIKVLKAQLESSQLSVSKDQKRAESAESRLKSLSTSLETTQAELGKAREEANYWCTEWKSLCTEAKEMCQETLEIVLDQVSHLCPSVDFSVINLKTRWDPKGRRIYIPEELLAEDAKAAKTLPEAVVGNAPLKKFVNFGIVLF